MPLSLSEESYSSRFAGGRRRQSMLFCLAASVFIICALRIERKVCRRERRFPFVRVLFVHALFVRALFVPALSWHHDRDLLLGRAAAAILSYHHDGMLPRIERLGEMPERSIL